MTKFETKHLSMKRDAIAPDGSDVRILLGLEGGGVAHFELAPGQTSVSVAHHTIEEIWYFLSGRGEMWRKLDDQEELVDVYPGVCITIPVGTCFQFRSFGFEPLAALGVTMPPWPGDSEAYQVEGKWKPTVVEVISQKNLIHRKIYTDELTKMNILIISHSADPDGLISTAFISHILESMGEPYEIRFADYPNLTKVINNTANEK